MGRPKKTKPKECKKKMVKKYRVLIEKQWRDFDSQKLAREWLKELIQAPIYFITMNSVEVEEEDC